MKRNQFSQRLLWGVVSVVLGLLLSGWRAGGQAAALAQTSATETWTLKGYALGKDAGNETGMVYMADVIGLDSGTYRMYYGYVASAGATQLALTARRQAAPTGPSIKYAESADGTTWTVKGTVLQGSADPTDREYSVSGPSVVKLPDGRYRMYYQSNPLPDLATKEEPKFHVRSAISNDGVNFTREGVRIEISSVDSNSPLKLAGHGTYFLASDGTCVGIFSGNFKDEMGPSELVMATSSDGLSFPYSNIKRLYEDWHDPIVIKVEGGYRMYATYLLEKTATAFSSDGLTWPAEMTQVTFKDASGNTLTEESPGIGDFGATLLTSGAIRLFSNYGSPSENIAYFDKALSVTSITPSSGLNDGPVSITDLTGTGFSANATVKLTKSGQSEILATNVVVVSSAKITCTFDLTGAAMGQWDVVVTNTDSQSGTLQGGFTIDAEPPTVASCAATRQTINIVFSKPVNKADAETKANYTITVGKTTVNLGTYKGPTTVSYDQSTNTTTISSSKVRLPKGGTVKVRVTGVHDVAGNLIVDNGTTNVGTATVPRRLGALSICGLQALASRSNTLLRWIVDSESSVQVRILTPQGRVVRVLGPVQARAGMNTLMWDRRLSNGRLAGKGLYLLEVQAQGEDGRRARAVRSLSLR